MKALIKDFLNHKTFAVAGSFRNESKYAYKIFRTLKKKGHTVFPINPKIDAVDGVRCWADVSDVPDHIDVAVLVTPPAVTEKIVCTCYVSGINKIWMQPGAESPRAVQFCKNNQMAIVYNLCVMLESQ